MGGLDTFRSSSTPAHDVRADDGRLVDLHRHAGILQALRDARRGGDQRLRDARRHITLTEGSGHGRSPTARRDDERRRGALRRGRPTGSSAGSDAVPRRETADLDEAVRWPRTLAPPPRPSRSVCSALRRGVAELSAGFRSDVVTQTKPYDPPGAYIPAGLTSRPRPSSAPSDPEGYQRPPRLDGPALRGDGGLLDAGGRFDYGNNLRREPRSGGSAGVRVPGVRAGLRPPDVLRGQGSLPLGALSAIPRTS